MKVTFSARDPNILMEADVGNLFVPLGPALVECVCAVRCHTNPAHGFAVAVPEDKRLDPGAMVPVTVLGCRVERGDPEYYPPGYETFLSGTTPIAFLEQVEAAPFRERNADTEIRRVDSSRSVGHYDRIDRALDRALGVTEAAIDRLQKGTPNAMP